MRGRRDRAWAEKARCCEYHARSLCARMHSTMLWWLLHTCKRSAHARSFLLMRSVSAAEREKEL